MRKIFIVLLSLSIGFVNAQTIDANTAAKTITAAGLKKHLSIIAGEEMQGRETGTEGERKAASYLVSQYKKMELTPGNAGSYRMPFSLFQDKLTNYILHPTFKFNDIREDIYSIFIFDLNIEACIWTIIYSLHVPYEKMKRILYTTIIFFQQYNNNYRPIYHLENYIYSLIKIIHIENTEQYTYELSTSS